MSGIGGSDYLAILFRLSNQARQPMGREKATPASAASDGKQTSVYREAPKNTACTLAVIATTAVQTRVGGDARRDRPRKSAAVTRPTHPTQAKGSSPAAPERAATTRRARGRGPSARATAKRAKRSSTR